MAMNFRDALAFTLEYEGGYAHHPYDPGGETNLFAKLELTLSAGAACVLSGFDMHGQIDTLGSREEYVK